MCFSSANAYVSQLTRERQQRPFRHRTVPPCRLRPQHLTFTWRLTAPCQYTSIKEVTVRDPESSATLVGRHALKLTVLFLETIRKPLELNRPGTFPTSSHTKGATEAERRVTVCPVSSSCTSACKKQTDTHRV